MKSAAFVIALVGLMVLVAGGISQIQARSGTVMDFCPPQGTMNCAIVAKFWLKQANPDDRQIGGVADAIVGSTRDHAISARACADTAEALRALAAAAHGAALRTRIGGLAELLCARRNGIATLSQSLLGDTIFGKARAGGPGRWGSSGTSWPAGFYYGYELACNGVGQDCHIACRTGTSAQQVTDCPPPPVGTIIWGEAQYDYHHYQWTCEGAGQSCHWDCLQDVSNSPQTCSSPPNWGNGTPTDGSYGDGTGWGHYGYAIECTDEGLCFWACSGAGHGVTFCRQPPAGTIGETNDHYYEWTCSAGQSCEWTCLDTDRPGSGACGTPPVWNEDGSSGNVAGCGYGQNLNACEGSSSGSSGQSSGSSGESSGSSGSSGEGPPVPCDDAQSSSGASGNSSGSSGQSSSGASGNSSGQGACDDGASSGGAGTSGSSGQSSGSSGESSGSSGSSGESSGSCDEGQSSSGASGNSSGSNGESSSGASGNSSGQGSCDDGASSGGAGTSGSSGQSSGSSGESSGSSGDDGTGGGDAGGGDDTGDGDDGAGSTSGSSGQSSGSSGESSGSSGESSGGGEEPPV